MILVSGGHHPDRRGAHHEGMYEYPETLRWATMVVEHLVGMGIEAMVVPTGRLPAKVRFINRQSQAHGDGDCLAVEIHFNSSHHYGVRGCETLYYPGSARGLEIARKLQAVMADIYPPDRGVKEGWYRMDKPGVVDFPGDEEGDEVIDFFLRKTRCTAVILEPEFIQRPRRIEMWRVECCRALAREIAREYPAKT